MVIVYCPNTALKRCLYRPSVKDKQTSRTRPGMSADNREAEPEMVESNVPSVNQDTTYYKKVTRKE